MAYRFVLFHLNLIGRIPSAMLNNLIAKFVRQVHEVDNAIFHREQAMAIAGEYMVWYDANKIFATDHVQDLFPVSQVEGYSMPVKSGSHPDCLYYPGTTGSCQ